MATAVQKITLSSSRDIPFNKLVLSQSNVRRVKAGISVEELAESIARRGLIQSLHVRPVVDAEGKRSSVLREDIDELVQSTKSLMPEGFEKSVNKKDLTDLLEFFARTPPPKK